MSVDSVDEIRRLKKEIVGLFDYMQRVRSEIAAIHKPVEEEHHLFKMEDQLDAIVAATEDATNTIMELMERNDEIVDQLRAQVTDDAARALLDEISANGMTVFEACSFQDITGQRISKVIKSMRYVEQRVNSIIGVWGKETIEHTEVGKSKKTIDEKLLAGPQLKGKGVSQADIDKLFD